MGSIIDKLSSKVCYFAFGIKVPFYLQYSLPAYFLHDIIKRLLNSRYIRLAIIFLPGIIYLISHLRNDFYFQSDDFAHFSLLSRSSYIDIIKVSLSPKGIWVGHRIVGGFWAFKLIHDIFGVEITPYIVGMFLLNTFNTYLFYKLLRKIKDSNFSVLMAFVFGTFYLSWISNIHELVGAAFLLLSVTKMLEWLEENERRNINWSLALYVFALASKEITFLLFPFLVLFIVFYKNYKKEIVYKKTFKVLLPHFFVFVLYFLFFALTFTSYFSVSGGGYSMTFSTSVYLENLRYYLAEIFPLIGINYYGPYILFGVFVLHDYFKKRLISLPFLASYLMFLTPPLFFDSRMASYYNYIPSIFLLIGIFVVFVNFWRWLENFLTKRFLLKKVALIYLVLLTLMPAFGINKFLLDRCFLIQYPWMNERREAIFGLVRKIEGLRVKPGSVIKVENADKMSTFLNSNILHLFFNDPHSRNFRYEYNNSQEEIVVNEK